jgi:hypothetical protein
MYWLAFKKTARCPHSSVLSGSARPLGDTADVAGIGIFSTFSLIRQGELEIVAIGHRTASVWDYIDPVRATQTRPMRGTVTY